MIFSTFRIEFNDRSFENSFIEFRFWGVPICVFLTLAGTIKENDKYANWKVLLIVLGSIFSLFFMFIFLLEGMCCDWTNKAILYTNKENHKIRIITREFGCIISFGDLDENDSQLSTIKNFKVEELSKYFIKAAEININDINEDDWIKLN